MTRIVVISGGLSTPSATRLLADQLAAATVRALTADGAGTGAEVRTIELRELARPIADNLVTGFPPSPLAEAVAAVSEADALIAVTPVFSASYSGLFKSFFDILEPGAIAGTPVLMAATAGSARHTLVLDHALRPLFAYLRAAPVPTAVFAASEDFGSSGLAERVTRAAQELADAARAAQSRSAKVESGRAGTHMRPADPFDDVTPFEDLLGA